MSAVIRYENGEFVAGAGISWSDNIASLPSQYLHISAKYHELRGSVLGGGQDIPLFLCPAPSLYIWQPYIYLGFGGVRQSTSSARRWREYRTGKARFRFSDAEIYRRVRNRSDSDLHRRCRTDRYSRRYYATRSQFRALRRRSPDYRAGRHAVRHHRIFQFAGSGRADDRGRLLTTL